MNIRRIFIIVAMAISVASCGIANNLTSDVFSQIKTVSIDKNIGGVTQASYHGAGENAAFALGGILGGFAAADSNMSKSQKLTLALKKSKIDLRAKVYKQFLLKLKSHPMFSNKLVRSSGDATFKLRLDKYGLYSKSAFSSKLEPEVNIRATLYDSNGKQIWTNFGYVWAMNFKGHEYTLEEYFSDPRKLNNAYDAAIEKAINSIMKSLRLALINGDIQIS